LLAGFVRQQLSSSTRQCIKLLVSVSFNSPPLDSLFGEPSAEVSVPIRASWSCYFSPGYERPFAVGSSAESGDTQQFCLAPPAVEHGQKGILPHMQTFLASL